MAISHVATQGPSYHFTVRNDLTGYYAGTIDIPATVAVDDIVLVWGAILSPGLEAAGFSKIVETVAMDPEFPDTTVDPSLRVWWRRWATGLPMSYEISFTDISLPPDTECGVTVWRGAQGMRDLASLVRHYTPHGSTDPGTAMVWPGVAGASGDEALLFAQYAVLVSGGSSIPVTGTSPASTNRYAATNPGGSYDTYLGDAALASAGTTPAYNGNHNAYTQHLATITLCGVLAPLAGSLVSPASGDTVDLTGGGNVRIKHNRAGVQGSASGAANAYAMRRKIGAGAYEYWNAGTASWQSTVQWNTIASPPANDKYDVAFPTGKWVNNTTYSVAVATQENVSNTQGPFGVDVPVTIRQLPVVVVTAPSGSVITTIPTVTWTATPASGASYTGWELKVFDAATYGAGGFSPDTSSPVYASGQKPTTVLTTTASGLSNAVTYRAYMRIRQTGNLWGAWAYSGFTVAVDAPAAPAVAATPSYPAGLCPRIGLAVQGRDNALLPEEADFETVTTPGTAGTNTTAATSTDQAARGTKSLKLTRTTSTGDATWTTGRRTIGAGEGQNLRVQARPGSTARTFRATVTFYDDSSVVAGSFTLPDATEVAGAWTESADDTVRPPTAVSAEVTVTVVGCASGEVHYIDMLALSPETTAAPVTAWSPGGLGAAGVLQVQASDDGGATWRDVRDADALVVDATEYVAVDDYEAQWGQATQYRARRVYVAGTDNIEGPWSAAVTATLDPGGCGWWILDPLQPTVAGKAVALTPSNDGDVQVNLRTDAYDVPSRQAQVVVKALTGLDTGHEDVLADDKAARTVLKALLGSGATLLLHQAQEGDEYPERRYIAPVGAITIGRLAQVAVAGWGWTTKRQVGFDWTQQDRP